VEVELGPRSGDLYPVAKGLIAGQRVAAAGAFLIDAETRLNPAAASAFFGATGGVRPASTQATQPPSAGDRNSNAPRAKAPADSRNGLTPDALKNIAQLPAADRQGALDQRVCPVRGIILGSMGVPYKVTLNGEPVYLCCQGCVADAKKNAGKILKRIVELKGGRKI
jgi:hypothetical protein